MGGLIESLKNLGRVRLLALAGVGVAVLGLIGVLALRASDPPMALLYGELDARDAGQIVAALERQRVPFRLGANGSQIMAPIDQVPRLRLSLARDGLPSGGGIGYELFDRGESLTTTPFQQDLNRLRALEGELSRTIRSLAGVRTARVHLVLPRREAFSRERGEAQASVVLTMQGSQRLDREGVQAVLHLVATAVPGLRPQGVSIVDSRGELLARGGQAVAGASAGGMTQEEMRRAQEARLSRSVEELLERTLGPGRVRAEATVEMDFDRVQTTEERYDPENQVARSQQSTTENNRNSEPQPTSVANNLPGADAQNQGGSTEQRQEETTNFEIGRTTRNTVREQPVIKRVSVAVLVDGILEPVEGGTPRWRERNQEELARLTALVRSAVGFDERRGDKVEVVSMRFADPDGVAGGDNGGLFGIAALSPAMLARLGESALLALVALAAILLLGKPMVGRLSAALAAPALAAAGAGAAAAGGAGVAALPGGAAAGATPAIAGPNGERIAAPAQLDPGAAALNESMVSLAHVEGQIKSSSLQALTTLVDAHPDEALAVMRRCLNPDAS